MFTCVELYGWLGYLCAIQVIFLSCFIGRRICEPAEGSSSICQHLVGLRLASEPGSLPFLALADSTPAFPATVPRGQLLQALISELLLGHRGPSGAQNL